MNNDKMSFRIIILIFISNNFHLWIEELKELALKIKIWEYINSYNQIAKSREEVLFEIFHFVVKSIASSAIDDLMTNQTSQSARASQSRLAKYFHELTIQQQENYRTSVKKYKRKKKQIVEITQRMLKINEAIRAFIKTYIFSKLMFVCIKDIL
jgi:hypothetical protein